MDRNRRRLADQPQFEFIAQLAAARIEGAGKAPAAIAVRRRADHLRGQLGTGGPGVAVAVEADPVQAPSDIPAEAPRRRDRRAPPAPVFTGPTT